MPYWGIFCAVGQIPARALHTRAARQRVKCGLPAFGWGPRAQASSGHILASAFPRASHQRAKVKGTPHHSHQIMLAQRPNPNQKWLVFVLRHTSGGCDQVDLFSAPSQVLSPHQTVPSEHPRADPHLTRPNPNWKWPLFGLRHMTGKFPAERPI